MDVDLAKFDAIKQETLDVVNKFKAQAKPGWAGLFGFIFGATGDMVEVVEASTAVVKDAKKETVVEAIKYAYNELNPDLPWIPEPFETKIEEWILDNGVPVLIDWLVGVFNDKGIFTHG